jgi:hypothetical protein
VPSRHRDKQQRKDHNNRDGSESNVCKLKTAHALHPASDVTDCPEFAIRSVTTVTEAPVLARYAQVVDERGGGQKNKTAVLRY